MRLALWMFLASLVLVLIGLGFRHVNGPRIVGRATVPDGTEMCVVQQCNWSGEPFTTRFAYRKRGATWGQFYFSHQDSYWSRSRAIVDTNAHLATFYRRGAPAVTFDWANEIYFMHRWNRTITGAQWRMPADWSPTKSLR